MPPRNEPNSGRRRGTNSRQDGGRPSGCVDATSRQVGALQNKTKPPHTINTNKQKSTHPGRDPGQKAAEIDITEPTWAPRRETTTRTDRQTGPTDCKDTVRYTHTHHHTPVTREWDPGKRATERSLCYTQAALERTSTRGQKHPDSDNTENRGQENTRQRWGRAQETGNITD